MSQKGGVHDAVTKFEEHLAALNSEDRSVMLEVLCLLIKRIDVFQNSEGRFTYHFSEESHSDGCESDGRQTEW